MSNRNPSSKQKKPSMARTGKSNGRWKGGTSKTYYRKKAGAKKGELVHHKDGDKKNVSKKNLKVIKPGKGISATGKHNKLHPEKGGDHRNELRLSVFDRSVHIKAKASRTNS